MAAIRLVELPPGSVVTPRADPFHNICAFEAKLLPVAVSVKPVDPAETEFGAMETNVGVPPDETAIDDHAFTRLKPSMDPSPVA